MHTEKTKKVEKCLLPWHGVTITTDATLLAEWEWTRSHLWLWHIRCLPEKHQVPHLPTGADHQPSQGIATVPRPTWKPKQLPEIKPTKDMHTHKITALQSPALTPGPHIFHQVPGQGLEGQRVRAGRITQPRCRERRGCAGFPAGWWLEGLSCACAAAKRPYKAKPEQTVRRAEVFLSAEKPPGNAQHTPGRDYSIFYSRLIE